MTTLDPGSPIGLRTFALLQRLLARAFFRVDVSGAERVPRSGPVLLAANHRNSLLDPMLLTVAAGRPMRFLAKATLFTDPRLGWMMRGSGAIPVHRRQDEPGQDVAGENVEAFRAVTDALRSGAAVGVFPEGRSHDGPDLAPLRTGAARLALDAAATGMRLPLVPVGLLFQAKHVFRTRAWCVVGAPIAYGDLVTPEGGSNRPAVLGLTGRIEEALRSVSLNASVAGEDELLAFAADVEAAASGRVLGPAERIARARTLRKMADGLRAQHDVAWEGVEERVAEHSFRLKRLDLTPADLAVRPGRAAVLRWLGRVARALPFAASIAAWTLYAPPYHLTDWAARRAPADEVDVVATTKALYGAALFLGWTLALAGVAARLGGWTAAIGLLLVLPPLAAAGRGSLERVSAAIRDARRFFRLHGSTEVARLRGAQTGLARALEEAQKRSAAAGIVGPG